jgi:hypothetical protein
MDELKEHLRVFIEEWRKEGKRKANLEIELLHFIKTELYKD